MNKSLPRIVLGGVVLLVLVVYMVVFQVRFTETAVVTTFGQPSEPKADPSWYMKWPWPIQKVVKYDNRIRIYDDIEEQTLTRDSKSLIVVTYCGWRIEDPLMFLQTVGSVADAEKQLRNVIRGHKTTVVGRYALANFVSTDPSELRFRQIEDEMRDGVQKDVAKYGVKAEMLGIRRMTLPQSVTESVFDRMKKTWEKIAAEYEEEGKAVAARIVTNAGQMADRIKSFAETRARAIETEGQARAAAMFRKFEEDPELAEFLLKLDYLKRTFSDQTVIYLDPSIEPSVQLLSGPPAGASRGATGSATSSGKAKKDKPTEKPKRTAPDAVAPAR